MVDGAKFNSHDSGSHFKKSTFKNGHWKKKIIYLCNWVEVASKIEHAVTTYVYTSNGIKISTFLKKKSGVEAEVVQCPFNVYGHGPLTLYGPGPFKSERIFY